MERIHSFEHVSLTGHFSLCPKNAFTLTRIYLIRESQVKNVSLTYIQKIETIENL